MSVDFNSTPLNTPATGETEMPMFAPIPSWERNRKRKGFGGKSRAAATVQAGTPVADESRDAYVAPRNAADATFATAPSFATRPVKKGRTGLPMMVAAGIVAIGGLAAAGWYASQPHETGVAQLTPGTESTAPAMPAAAPEMAANTPAPTLPVEVKAPPAATPARATTRMAAAIPARARPAAVSRSAGDAGVNTSATLPSAPQPYSGTATAPAAPADVAPVTAAPAWNIPPKAEAPAPAPVEAAPAPVIVTPPVQTPPN